MFALIRFVAGRRIGLLMLLAALAAGASPAIRDRCARLLACGVSLQAADLFGGSGTKVIDAATGGRALRGSPQQCVREAVHTAAAASTWVQRRTRVQ